MKVSIRNIPGQEHFLFQSTHLTICNLLPLLVNILTLPTSAGNYQVFVGTTILTHMRYKKNVLTSIIMGTIKSQKYATLPSLQIIVLSPDFVDLDCCKAK